eukprot:439375-Pelagomonas_calceolata.AAC.1
MAAIGSVLNGLTLFICNADTKDEEKSCHTNNLRFTLPQPPLREALTTLHILQPPLREAPTSAISQKRKKSQAGRTKTGRTEQVGVNDKGPSGAHVQVPARDSSAVCTTRDPWKAHLSVQCERVKRGTHTSVQCKR